MSPNAGEGGGVAGSQPMSTAVHMEPYTEFLYRFAPIPLAVFNLFILKLFFFSSVLSRVTDPDPYGS